MGRFRVPTKQDRWVAGVVIGIFTVLVVGGAVVYGGRHPAFVLLLIGAAVLLLAHWQARHCGYQCPACGHEFEISTMKELLSPHTPTMKYVRCPGCLQVGWAKVLRKIPEREGG